MLTYYDETGCLARDYLKTPAIKSSWILFENNQPSIMLDYFKSTANSNSSIVLNHQSYADMGVRFMDFNSSFGLCNMGKTNKNKEISLKSKSVENAYTAIVKSSCVDISEWEDYLHSVCGGDFGFVLYQYNKIRFNEILDCIKEKDIDALKKFDVDKISFFVDYHDCYKALVTFYINDISDNDIIENNVDYEYIESINNCYCWRISGSLQW